jgi:hypothetical protein
MKVGGPWPNKFNEKKMSYSKSDLLSVFGVKLIRDEIFTSLDLSDAGHIAAINKAYSAEFTTEECQNSLDILAAKKMLIYIREADWAAIQGLVAQRPEACFVHAKITDITGNQYYMSPLQYALFVYDFHAQKIFEKVSIDSDQVQRYRKQFASIKEYFDFLPLINTYDRFIKLLKKWRKSEITNAALDNYWCQALRQAQINFLPRHLLKQMCSKEWSMHGDLSGKNSSDAQLDVYVVGEKKYINLISIIKDCKPTRGALLRGDVYNLATIISTPHQLVIYQERIKNDYVVLQSLIRRCQQQNQPILLLNLEKEGQLSQRKNNII